jgi:hypothetical protein
MFGSQITNKWTIPNPPFLESQDRNKETTDLDTLSVFFRNFLQLQSSLCVGMFWKKIIFCVRYVDLCDDSENDILDSDIPTTSLCQQLQPSAIEFTSDSETSTVVEESSELLSSNDKTSDMGV